MSYTYNRFKDTTVSGNFNNKDYPDGSVLANATFDRNVNILGDMEIGNETSITDPDTGIVIYSQTGGNIKFKLNGTTYIIGKTELLKLLQNLATESYVNTKIADLIGSASSTLDTLQEIANALGNDPNFATTITTLIGTKANSSDLANYLTISNASSTYQPISGMSNYYTKYRMILLLRIIIQNHKLTQV